jgi:hypothetical protein
MNLLNRTMATIMTCPCSFLLVGEGGNELSKGEAEIELEKEKLSILPRLGEAITLSLVDIEEILTAEYRINLVISSHEHLSIFDLGYKFGDFISNLFHMRNEMILKYLLMNESVKLSGVWGDLSVIDLSGAEYQFEKSEVRLYETSIVLIPTVGEPIRVHYSNISQADAKDYSLAIATESGEKFIISRMGKEYDSVSRDLSEAINSLNIQCQTLLKDVAPSSNPSVIRNASRLMKDGKAARSSDLKAISPAIWEDLEKKLEKTPIWSEYQYLKSMAREDRIAIGVKRGLMGDLTGNYLWLLIPIYSKNPRYGNAIALESVRLATADSKASESSGGTLAEEDLSAATGGNATYFFRIIGRKDYAELASKTEELDARVDSMILKTNQLMLDINFRREPIFLSEEKIRAEPKYARYRYATQRISSLRQLRQLFIGRIIHSSFEQWKTDVTELLLFNMTADDTAKWEKS